MHVSQTNEDDVVSTWITHVGEGEAMKTYINVRVRHLKEKNSHVDTFEDTLGLFKNKEYVTTRFVRYKRPSTVREGELKYGLKGMIYTRTNTEAQGSYYFFEHYDHESDEDNEDHDHYTKTEVKLGLSEDEKATWLDCTFNREFEEGGYLLNQKCFVNVYNTEAKS
jgi:hypothetical protein